jgi:hypothetical protein
LLLERRLDACRFAALQARRGIERLVDPGGERTGRERNDKPCRDDQPMREGRAFGRLQLGLHTEKGPPPGGPFKEIPVRG